MTYSYTYSRYTHTYTHTRWQCCCGSWWCMILQQSCLTRYIIVSFACCRWCFIFLSFLYEFKQTTSWKTWPRLKRLWIVARSPSLLMLLHSSAPHKHPPSTNKSEYTNSHTSDTRLRIHHHRCNNHHRHTFGFVMLLRLLTFTSNDDVFAGMCISHRR